MTSGAKEMLRINRLASFQTPPFSSWRRRSPDPARRISELSVEHDRAEILRILLDEEFPSDLVRALELALLRTFTIPSIAELLNRTKQFENAGQKRYDDTAAIIYSILSEAEATADGELGPAALRMNAIHSHYEISNEDFLYVLTTFAVDPIDWLDNYGWRPLTDHEKAALFSAVHEMGVGMGLTDIPDSLDAIYEYNRRYQAEHCRPAVANREVTIAGMRIVQDWLPSWLQWSVAPALSSLIDDQSRESFGIAKPNRLLEGTTKLGLAVRKRFLASINPYAKVDYSATIGWRTYPSGFQLDEVGPTKLMRRIRSRHNADDPLA